ncbi:MAG: peptidoglycan DD-metalloendopeptidase family protein [Prevotella sp.]|jgi:septal ring factor EnvC (AmiA/AmiB activator)|nr:peptidoglycan DD-metalloendopeptidase family protein [Prevotella sp.]MCH4212331.1 peptidoglycan DD-metalloendopeptidase family protein [Prevotella sp.]MCH4240297.1 peptidoglycan DD-metalloendopeptidase family protein [Prevotella sp.]
MRRLLLILLVLSFPLCSFTQNRHQKTNVKTTVVSKRLTKHHRTQKSKAIQKQSKKKNNKVRRKANASQTSIHSLQRQRAAIQRKIRQQEAALRANRNAVHQRLQNLMLINGEIDQSQQKIDGIQKDIDHINGNIGILKGQLSTLEQQLQDRKAKYIRSMRYMSRHHSVQDKLMFIFSAKNFAQMYRRLQFIRQYSAYQKAQGRIVEAKQLEVNRKHHQLVNVKGHKNVLLYKGKIEKNNLQVKHGQQQQVVESLKDQQKTIQEIIAEQHKKNAALNAQIDRLVAQEVARERAAAAAEARRKSAEVAKKRAQMLAQKRAAAAAAAAANAQRIAQAKAREAQLKAAARAAEEARQKAIEETAAARQAQTDATKKAQAIAAARKAEEARQAQAAATARKTEADQAAREAEADRKAAERKAQADAERNRKEIAVAKQQEQNTLSLTAVDRMMNSGFEANRGRLPMPITGNYHVVSHFGEYNVAGLKGVTLDNKGINILGGPGAMARSIYDGEVSYVFSYGGSMVVMIRHGAYISVYCNLKSVSVHKGQKVHTRQLLGAVCPDHILQFQLRRETAKLNPEVWLER